MHEIICEKCSICMDYEESIYHKNRFLCPECYEEIIQEEQDEELGKRKD